MKRPLRVAIIAAPIQQIGLKQMLIPFESLEVVFQSSEHDALVDELKLCSPDLLVCTVNFLRQIGKEKIESMRAANEMRFVILQERLSLSDICDAAKFKVDAICLFDEDEQEFKLAIDSLVSKKAWLAPELVKSVLQIIQNDGAPSKCDAKTFNLTKRELDVLNLLSKGESNRQIAEALGLSNETIKTHVHNILKKMHTRDRTAAAVMSIRSGFVRTA